MVVGTIRALAAAGADAESRLGGVHTYVVKVCGDAHLAPTSGENSGPTSPKSKFRWSSLRGFTFLTREVGVILFVWLLCYIVQLSSVAQSYPTLCDPMNCSTPGLPVHQQLPESTQTHFHLVSDAIQPSILCHPLLLLPSIFPSIRVFSSESALRIRWPKDWSFSFNISPDEHSVPISFRMDWLDLLAVQGTLKSLLQHNSSKASIL